VRIGRIACVHAKFAEVAKFASTSERLGTGGVHFCTMCHTELAHDVCLSMQKSRRGTAASAGAGAKCAYSDLRGSMEKDSQKGANHEFKAPAPD
jgi:hypothetical protein